MDSPSRCKHLGQQVWRHAMGRLGPRGVPQDPDGESHGVPGRLEAEISGHHTKEVGRAPEVGSPLDETRPIDTAEGAAAAAARLPAASEEEEETTNPTPSFPRRRGGAPAAAAEAGALWQGQLTDELQREGSEGGTTEAAKVAAGAATAADGRGRLGGRLEPVRRQGDVQDGGKELLSAHVCAGSEDGAAEADLGEGPGHGGKAHGKLQERMPFPTEEEQQSKAGAERFKHFIHNA
mmetsp:Transcript_4190/g.10749  ORF Transcript_4190/g.10749 Transcript_4190/m.10749 type:complete len:236 (+) Transcript_4190:349-1056(+)